MDMPFGGSEFDAATMGYGLRNVADIPRALRELNRVLKPGVYGTVCWTNGVLEGGVVWCGVV
jgi:demethylmenaquinone methyltransferase/2-methoxy-6-polyprenyl-1,4-benzoquinol methylase